MFPSFRFGRVDEARRRLQLALYVESLLEAELEAKQKALVLLKALIRLVEVWGWGVWKPSRRRWCCSRRSYG